MALSFLQAAGRAWNAAHEFAAAQGSLDAAAGLCRLGRDRAWAAGSCLREWRWEMGRKLAAAAKA
jgi:hypothetical protein